VFPLANLVATGQVRLGDFVRVDMDGGHMTFIKEAEGAVLPGMLERFGTASAQGAQAARTARTLTIRREFGAGGIPESK
jgi:hypothetical protein